MFYGANGAFANIFTCLLLQVASSTSTQRKWSAYSVINSVKCNRDGSQREADLVFVHSYLHHVSHRGEEYISGPYQEWDWDLESPDLNHFLAT